MKVLRVLCPNLTDDSMVDKMKRRASRREEMKRKTTTPKKKTRKKKTKGKMKEM